MHRPHRYEYLIPAWALDPQVGRPRAQLQQQQQQQQQQPPPQQHQQHEQPITPGSGPTPAAASEPTPAAPPPAAHHVTGAAGPTAATTNAERSRLRAEADIASSSFCLGPSDLKRLNLILGVFVGSHCFHNFTSEVRARVSGTAHMAAFLVCAHHC